ncbi:restriction endonuclease subunit S [Vibrio parahaemolyticus]|uniref:restriction endonuclease subunit S n=1 Tax=Vibrio parahaemolyticus TaxID=670 RepID=UPI001EE9FDC7|nr:restriction endonuclease subunit S [Vibrio parahaemolyticus]ELA3123234.1 restriction endonuclease subunit S [Vibrio parahaemolyticus]MCG6435222.1 restriction endonuclease subunit S [Vibrio parahaemolyticus]
MSWPLVKLGDLFKVTSGGTPSRKKPEYYDGGDIHWVKTGDLHNKYVRTASEFITQEGLDGSSARRYPKGTVLVAMYGATIGACSILDIEAATNQACAAFTPTEKVDPVFLYYLLKHSKPAFVKAGSGGAQPNISGTFLKNFEIPLPPIDEQKCIAAILDKADAIRQKRKQAIDLADEFLRSVFLDMFGDPVTNPKGWEEHALKDITDVRSGVAKGKKVSLDDSVTLPYMRVANVQDGYLDLSEIKQIVVSKKDAEKCQLIKGDVLLTEGGDPDKLGRGYVWNNEIENCIHQNHIFSVRIENHHFVHPHFLSAQISSQRGKLYFLKVGKQTTGIATINKTVLRDFVVFIPPLELQKKYVAIKNKVDNFKRKCESDDLKLFRSISHKFFSG